MIAKWLEYFKSYEEKILDDLLLKVKLMVLLKEEFKTLISNSRSLRFQTQLIHLGVLWFVSFKSHKLINLFRPKDRHLTWESLSKYATIWLYRYSINHFLLSAIVCQLLFQLLFIKHQKYQEAFQPLKMYLNQIGTHNC